MKISNYNIYRVKDMLKPILEWNERKIDHIAKVKNREITKIEL